MYGVCALLHKASPDSLKRRLASLGLLLILLIAVASPAGAAEKILYALSNDTAAGSNDTLYSMNPDGTGRKKLFDFSDNAYDDTGNISQLRVGPKGEYIYFNSDNAFLWTPSRANLFRIRSDGTGRDQITPDAASGTWNLACYPCGRVEGKIEDSAGRPYGNAPVFIEGLQMKNARADGTFGFDFVPPGVRFAVGYRPADTTGTYDALPLNIAANVTTNVQLVPDSSGRNNYEQPALFGDRIYFKAWPDRVRWTDLQASTTTTVYQVTQGLCTVPDVDGFDVGPKTGRLAVMDHATWCTGHAGLYLTDKDGSTPPQLLANFRDGDWCGAKDVFWSPDESMLAVTACRVLSYQWYYGLVIVDAASGATLGQAWATTPNDPNFVNFRLHGWSPDGGWLLYSLWIGSPDKTSLVKIKVDRTQSNSLLSSATGRAVEVTLLADQPLSGATWGNLNPPPIPPAPVLSAAVSAGLAAGNVDIRWSSVPGAAGYWLYYADYPLAKNIDRIDVKTFTGGKVTLPSGFKLYLAVWPYTAAGTLLALSNIALLAVP